MTFARRMAAFASLLALVAFAADPGHWWQMTCALACGLWVAHASNEKD